MKTKPIFELRATQQGKAKKLTGYAATYGTRSGLIQDRSGRAFYEILLPGCFDSVLAGPDLDCRLTIQHDPGKTLARTSAGSLQLVSDDKGLRFTATLPDTTEANDLWTNVQAGNFNECSFVFQNPTVQWQTSTDASGDECLLRLIQNFDQGELRDISVVANPAYPGTSVNARSNSAAQHDDTDIDADEDEWDLFGPDYDETKQDRAHVGDGDCNIPSCGCQNRMLTRRSKRESFHDTLLRTKRVGGDDCHAGEFAHVPDPDKTESWRLCMRGGHAAKSLARFHSVATGIGVDREEILGRILAAVRMTLSEVPVERDSDEDAAIARRRNLLTAVLS